MQGVVSGAATPAEVESYMRSGWWTHEAITDVIRRHVDTQPHSTAFIDEHGDAMSWLEYDAISDRIAATLVAMGLEPGSCAAVIMPDGPLVHAAFVGAEKAGVVVMGIGHRAGESEIRHLIRRSKPEAIITTADVAGRSATELVDRLVDSSGRCPHVLIQGSARACDITVRGSGSRRSLHDSGDELRAIIDDRRLGPTDLFLLNSTSGTTGLPKCVMQFQNRWHYFHRVAEELGHLSRSDVFMSVVPAPFGFGLWTAHFTPTYLGSTCVVMSRFEADRMTDLIEQERVSVLCCVSTQFIMMLNSPGADRRDLSSLRVMFTGGEAIPEARAREFEERTGASVLNFYGSNETGLLSGTRLEDTVERRLTGCGQIVADMQVRLYTAEGQRISGDRGRGIPACRGPAIALGYYDDPEANGQLFTTDGWMLMGDVVEIDDDGWLSVVGRVSDFIIRGGKNISAPAVEEEIATHPAVSMVAVVAAPDPVFGERVAACVELRAGAQLDLDGLREHLIGRGVSKEWLPEYLFVETELPRASGGKVAKGQLREAVAGRVAAD